VPALPPGTLTASGGVATPNVTTVTGLGSATPNPELGGATGFSPGGATESTPTSFASVLAGIQDFTKNNQLLTFGALQAGGSLISGLTSTLTPAQVTALNAQAAANDAAAALTKQQTQNLSMPKSVATSAPVTGTPATLVPGVSSSAPAGSSAAGFINKAPAVTGVPA
jgi:hypothetical protein